MTLTPHAPSLERTLRSGRFVITAELTPPLTCDAHAIRAKAASLRGLADAVNVTDAAGARVHLSALVAAAILRAEGVEPILQMTCRDRNRIALQGDLLAAAATGLNNLLILRGDDPTAGDQPDAKAVFDLDTRTLIETAARLRDSGTLPAGKTVGGKAEFFIGAADTPFDPPADWQPDGLRAKIAAGAQFVQTQFCMDAALARRYMARLAESGVTRGVHFLIGIAPLPSAKSARWIRKHLPGSVIPDAIEQRLERSADPAQEGRRIALELIAELSDIAGISGVHVMAPGHDAGLAAFLRQAQSMRR